MRNNLCPTHLGMGLLYLPTCNLISSNTVKRASRESSGSTFGKVRTPNWYWWNSFLHSWTLILTNVSFYQAKTEGKVFSYNPEHELTIHNHAATYVCMLIARDSAQQRWTTFERITTTQYHITKKDEIQSIKNVWIEMGSILS